MMTTRTPDLAVPSDGDSDDGQPAAATIHTWLRRHRPQVEAPLTVSLITGGRSNLTYLLTDAGGTRWVLRRPPLVGVIASAHDVLREHRIMGALTGTGIPVPSMVAPCDDASLIGAPFFVMDYVDGIVLRDQRTAEVGLVERARGQVGDSLVDALATLHRVRPADVGLGNLGKGIDYVARQLARWAIQLERLGVPESRGMHEVLRRLQAGLPEQHEVTIVHGDFRPGNAIVGRDGHVRAIVDWELATLGDPLADLGWLLAYWGSPDPGPTEVPMPVPTRATGFARREQLAQRYSARSGRSSADLDFYIAFALWRLAAIMSGVNARARQGAYGRAGEAIADQDADRRVERLIAAAEAATSAAGR